MPTTPFASQIHLHDPLPTTPAKRTYIIYFVTGNPGLIEYYRTFLTHLYGLLTQKAPASTTFHVFGRSLSGFETAFASRTAKLGTHDRPPFSLQDQISRCQEFLEGLVQDVKVREGVQDLRVVMMGHSVGSYILFETIRRVREKARGKKDAPRIVGGVCLFPTVTHIAKSESGRKATPLFNLPYFALIASILAKGLTVFLPPSFCTFLVQKVLSFPADAAAVTAAFVKSPYGVHQALHMARDEMREITSDAWDDEIWGALGPSAHAHPRPILRFLFAKKDHWIADETRDELIKARGRRRAEQTEEEGDDRNGDGGEDEGWKPVMEIDEEEGWVHGFCIRQSVPVAERVCEWVRDIVSLDEARW